MLKRYDTRVFSVQPAITAIGVSPLTYSVVVKGKSSDGKTLTSLSMTELASSSRNVQARGKLSLLNDSNTSATLAPRYVVAGCASGDIVIFQWASEAQKPVYPCYAPDVCKRICNQNIQVLDLI